MWQMAQPHVATARGVQAVCATLTWLVSSHTVGARHGSKTCDPRGTATLRTRRRTFSLQRSTGQLHQKERCRKWLAWLTEGNFPLYFAV